MPRPITLEMLDTIQGEPHAPSGTVRYRKEIMDSEVPKPNLDIPQVVQEQVAQPRNVYIKTAMLDKHGYSPQCPKCRAIQRGVGGVKEWAIPGNAGPASRRR